jgi:inosose dehydratase
MRVDLGCGQITWRGLSPESALADIARAGYAGAPWGGRNSSSAADVVALHQKYGLAPAPSYFGGEFWDPSQREAHVAAARRYGEISRELGLSEVYVASSGFDRQTRSGRTRKQAAAHVTEDDKLTDQEFGELVRTLRAVGETLNEYGVRACFHNHVGTFVETEDEIERLLAAIDPEVLYLGPDTGHLAWAGVDPVAFTRRHAERIKTMHLKDMSAQVRDQGVAENWDYGTFEAHAIWAEIGEGAVDFPAIFEILDGAGFDGWLIVETDVTQKESPYESARVSRENLRKLGI